MGFRISWLAVQGGTPEAICDRLGLEVTAPHTGEPEGRYIEQTIPGGWNLVWSWEVDDPLFTKQALGALSAMGPLVHVSLSETVMVSMSEFWERGTRIWRAEHDSDRGHDHVSCSGVAPSFYTTIRDEIVARQEEEGGADAGVDYIFEIPVRMAEQLTGFRHDSTWPEPPNGRPANVLRPKISPSRRGAGLLRWLSGY